jgi:hypothetical protein
VYHINILKPTVEAVALIIMVCPDAVASLSPLDTFVWWFVVGSQVLTVAMMINQVCLARARPALPCD